MEDETLKRQPLGFFLLTLIIMFSSHALPAWLATITNHYQRPALSSLGANNFQELIFVLFSICLIAHDPRGYGIRLGDAMHRN